MHVCSDFPEELSKLSLTEQPSPLFCERKADLWQHINGIALEEGDFDICPYHGHLNLLPAANPGYLTVINGRHVGPLMTVPPYRRSQDEAACCTLEHHNSNSAGNGCRPNWDFARNGTVSAAGNGVAGTTVSRRASVSTSYRCSSTAAPTENKLQTVSHFSSSLHMYYTLSLEKPCQLWLATAWMSISWFRQFMVDNMFRYWLQVLLYYLIYRVSQKGNPPPKKKALNNILAYAEPNFAQ